MKKSFGSFLKDLRRTKSVSQRELAQKVGVDFSYISKIENDRLPPPSVLTTQKICDALDVPHETLLSYSGKVSDDIKKIIISSPEVVQFLKEVKSMNLSGSDWEKLTSSLKRLK